MSNFGESKIGIKMKNQIKLLSIFALLLIITAVNAQPRFSVDDQIKNLSKILNLTGKQAEALKPILNAKMKKMESFRIENKGNRDEMREFMQKINKDYDEKILKLLDDEQKIKYEKWTAEREKRRPERPMRLN